MVAEEQKSIAESSEYRCFLVEGYQPPALSISNNNSICELCNHLPVCRTLRSLLWRRTQSCGQDEHDHATIAVMPACKLAMPVEIGSNVNQL